MEPREEKRINVEPGKEQYLDIFDRRESAKTNRRRPRESSRFWKKRQGDDLESAKSLLSQRGAQKRRYNTPI